MSSIRTGLSNRLKYYFLRYVYGIKTPKDLIVFLNKRYSDRKVVVQNDRFYTFQDINENANRFCHAAFEAGLKKGDRIVVYLKNNVEYLEIRLASYKAGFVFKRTFAKHSPIKTILFRPLS